MALTRPAPAPPDSDADPVRSRGPAPRSPGSGRAAPAARSAALLALAAALVGTVAGLRGPAGYRLLICGLELLAAAAAVFALAAGRGGRGAAEAPQQAAVAQQQPASAPNQGPESESPAPAAHVRHAYVSLARRIQALVNRQLRELREMEDRHGADPAVFADLLHLDHATALVGRLADSLAVLGGERAGRRWTRPAPLLDVFRGAMSRITEYRRVTIGRLPEQAAVAGDAVEGLVHALAELLDNATRYSPPDTHVVLSAASLPDGLVIEVEDSGVGLGPEAQARAALVLATENAGLEVAALGTTPRLGLAVVGRLARAIGFEVMLEPGDGGGVRASILLPNRLVTEARPEPAAPADRDARPGMEPSRIAAARHAAPEPGEPAVPAAADADTVNGLPRRRRYSPGHDLAAAHAPAAPPAPPPRPTAPSAPAAPAPPSDAGPGQWLGLLHAAPREGLSPRKKKEGMAP